MAERVTVRSAGGRLVAVKGASTEDEVTRLGHEAELLRRSAHPGVVAIVSFTTGPEGAELILTAPSERTAADELPDTLRGCLDFVAAVADTVADLHALGVAHCALRPDHVLVTAQGQPVLCGFGSAQPVIDPQLFTADVVALGELLAWLARRMPTDYRSARRVAGVLTRSRVPNTTARELAFAMADGHRDAEERPTPVAPRKPVIVVVLALAAIATGVALFTGDKPSTSAGPATTTPSSLGTTVDPTPSDTPLVEIRGTSYRVGQPGDLAYFVPCPDNQRVVVLRPTTGDLFIFDHLAEAGAPRTAQSAGRVAGAIEIVPSADETCSEFGVVTEHALIRIPVPTSTRKTQ